MSDANARDEWVQRVLGIAVGGGAGRTGRADGPTVAYRKMLLSWRSAQQSVDEGLRQVAAAILGHPTVKADPRFPEVEAAVAALPKLIPAFGGALEDVLDAGLNTNDPVELARLSAQGVTAIDAYRQQLAGASRLLALEQLVATELGSRTVLHGALDEALLDIRRRLAA